MSIQSLAARPPATREKSDFLSTQQQMFDAGPRCPNCGCEVGSVGNTSIRRGVVTLSRDPLKIHRNGILVPLSPIEAEIFAVIFARGQASFERIDQEIVKAGGSVKNRHVFVWRIRRKFVALGSPDPFSRLGIIGLRYVPEPDAEGCAAIIIGEPAAH